MVTDIYDLESALLKVRSIERRDVNVTLAAYGVHLHGRFIQTCFFSAVDVDDSLHFLATFDLVDNWIPSNMYNKINYNSSRKTSLGAFKEKLTEKSRPQTNDILLSKDGTLGRVAVVDNHTICINQSVALSRPNGRILPRFLYYLLFAKGKRRRAVGQKRYGFAPYWVQIPPGLSPDCSQVRVQNSSRPRLADRVWTSDVWYWREEKAPNKIFGGPAGIRTPDLRLSTSPIRRLTQNASRASLQRLDPD